MHRIAGIYNYCNRWCERCPLGHRCAVNSRHAGDQEWMDNLTKKMKFPDSSSSSLPLDEAEEELWDQSLSTQEQGTFSEAPDPFEHTLVRGINELTNQLTGILDLLDDYWTAQVQKNYFQPPVLYGEEEVQIDNAREILAWYQPFLPSKVIRAVAGLQENPQAPRATSDWNGTAKVALIGLDHCLGASHQLQKHLSGRFPDSLRQFERDLRHYRQQFIETFPHTEAFRRPGFDTLGIREDYGV